MADCYEVLYIARYNNMNLNDELLHNWDQEDMDFLKCFIKSRNKFKTLNASPGGNPMLNRFSSTEPVLDEDSRKDIQSRRYELFYEIFDYLNLMSLPQSSLGPLYCCHQDFVVFCEDYGAPTQPVSSEGEETESVQHDELPMKRLKCNP